MIVKKVYYGTREIARVFANNELIWQADTIGSTYYDIFLTIDVQEETSAVASIVKDIGFGKVACSVNENADTNSDRVDIETFVHNTNLEVDYGIRKSFLTITRLVMGVIDSNDKNNVDVYVVNNGTPICSITDINTCKVSLSVFHDDNITVAKAVARGHTQVCHVDVYYKHTGLGVSAKVLKHRLDTFLSVYYAQTGVEANALVGGHELTNRIAIGYLNDGIGAVGIMVAQDADTSVFEYDNLYHIAISCETFLYDICNGISEIEEGFVTYTVVDNIYYDTGLTVNEDEYNNVGSYVSILGNKFVVLTPNDNVDGLATSLPTVQLYKDDILTADNNIDGNFQVLDIRLPEYIVYTSAIDVIDDGIKSLMIASLTSNINDKTYRNELNSSLIDIANLSTDILCTGVNEEELYCELTEPSAWSYVSDELVSESSLSTGFEGLMVSGDHSVTYPCVTYAEVYIEDGAELVIPEFIYPIRNGNDLYIPQVFAVERNGTNLNFNIND